MTIEMINKNKFRVASDKKLLRKVGKQWVVVGTLALALLGGGAVMATTVTHADTNSPAVEAQDTNSVKKQINSNLGKAYQATQSASGSSVASSKASQSSTSSSQASSANKPSNVESKANDMHDALLQNATAKTSSSLTNVNSAKSSVASSGSVSSSAKPSFNSAYQSYMAKMSGTDAKVASANDTNTQSSNENIKKPLLKDNNDVKPESYYFSGNVIKTSSDDGLNYKVWSNGGVEFASGTANSDLSHFELNPNYMSDIENSDVYNAKAIKFDNDIDTSHVTNMAYMFAHTSDVPESLRLLDLGNNFDTHNVTNMDGMFFGDYDLQSLKLPNSFDTHNVTNMNGMFFMDYDLQSLKLPNSFDTSNVTRMSDMFALDKSLQSLDLGNNFNTHNVTNMRVMFDADKSLKSLNLGNNFDTSNVTNMGGMLSDEISLQSLNLGNHFDTSKVTNMRYLFRDDSLLKTLNLGSHFNTHNVTDMFEMFMNDNLHKLIVQSSDTKIDTKLSSEYGSAKLHLMYKPLQEKDSKGNSYTLTTPNNFSKGNVGTFVSPENPKPITDTINFVDNNKSIGTTTPSGVKGNPAIINVPSGYHVTNPSSDNLTYDGQPHTVHVTGNTIKGMATIHLVYNAKDSDGNVHTYSQGVDNSKPNYTSSDVIIEPIDTQVGDTVTFKPSQFNKPNYSTNDSDWTISFTPSDAPVDENDDFNQDHTFTYTGQEATHQEVRYIDITNGAQMATSGQFAGQYNNQSPIGPVVGIQNVSDIGVQGQDDVLEPVLGQGSINIFYYDANTGVIKGQKTVQAAIGTQDNVYQQIHQYAPKNYSVDDNSISNRVVTVTKAPQNCYVAVNPVVTTGKISLIYLNEDNGVKVGNTDTVSGNIGSSYNVYQEAHQQVPSGYTVDDDTDFSGMIPKVATFTKSPQNLYIAIKPLSTAPSLGLSKRALLAADDNGNVYKILRVPTGYTLVNNENPFKLADNGVYNVAVQSKTVSDKVQFINEQSGKPMGSPILSNGTFDTLVNTSNIKVPSHYMIDNSNPENQKLMKNGKLNIIHDGTTHNVYIKRAPSFINVIEYVDNNDSDVGDTSAYGQEGTDVPDKVIKDDVPKDYQLSPSQTLPVQFTKDNVIKVAVQSDNHNSDMVVGTAFLTLLYQKGNRTDGKVLRLHINGNIGDSPIVINPQDYDHDGYSVASSDNVWKIPFDYTDVKKATNDFSRYNVENTFTYQAKPTKIQIEYIDTQTGNPVPNAQVQIFNNIAYDGDTADLQGTNSDNNVLGVDGSEYHLNLPSGYHLAHMNNYIKVTANGTYVKPVTTVGGTRMLRMPLMKLTLGITPHVNKHNTKPASTSSVTPVKPSSASSVTPQSASSASTEPSSASITPSSASQNQSVAPTPSTSTASSMTAPSSTASVAPVTSNVTSSSATSSTAQPSSVTPSSVSIKPSSISTNKTIARSVIRHVSHKHVTKKRVHKPVTKKHAKKAVIKPVAHHTSHKKMAKHDNKRLNHQVTQDKHKLNIVEHHMEARKAIIRKATHAKRAIKVAKHKLHYLRHNKRHVKHALRRITRNKVAIKHAKRVVRTAKQARPKFVHAKAATVEPTTDKFAATSVKAPVATPKVHAKSTVTTYTSHKKLPQTSEATDHAGIIAIVLMIMSVILAGFDKVFSREHNE